MARRYVILGFIFSIAALLIAAFGGAYLVELTQNRNVRVAAGALTVASALSAIAFLFMIFVSLMTKFILLCVPAETIQRKSGNLLYYLQWLEVRAEFDALKDVGENP
jgi:hypothetical protein